MESFIKILLVLILTTGNEHAYCKVYHIKPSLTDQCPQRPCINLAEFTHKRSQEKNITLHFLPGVHTLHMDYSRGNLEKFSMSSSIDTLKANISCKKYSRFNLFKIKQVLIYGLNFQGCGGNKFAKVNDLRIYNSLFVHNHGAALELNRTKATIQNVSFLSNSALNCKDSDPQCCLVGGAMRIITSNTTILSSVFTNNVALSGGAIFSYGRSNTEIVNSTFIENKAICNRTDCYYRICKLTNYLRKWSETKELQMHGGAITAYGGKVLLITNSFFARNQANTTGGAVYVIWAQAFINCSKFYNNSAVHWGGASHTLYNTVNILNSQFYNNSAVNGGALDVWRHATLTVDSTVFANNKAETGAVFWTNANSSLKLFNITLKENNATYGGVMYIFSSNALFDNSDFSYNNGSLYLFYSNVTITGKSQFCHNTGLPYRATGFQGGAITAFQSNINIHGECSVMHNHAQSGGAIYTAESKIWIFGRIEIAFNTVNESGGGIHLYQSDLNCHYNCRFEVVNNTAVRYGGGIHAVSSSVKVHQGSSCKKNYSVCALASIMFKGNNASKGGAISLEVNAKLYIFKIAPRKEPALSFISNNADKGGAIYVADDTNFGTCSSNSFSENKITTECFLQSLALHYKTGQKLKLVLKNTEFADNFATQSGPSLHGGLLDRCTVSFSAEIYKSYYYDSHNKISYPSVRTLTSGATNFFNITNATIDSVSSDPVRLCFCKQEQADCSYEPPVITAKRGEIFEITLVAVDQVNHTVSNATVHSSLAYTEGGLGEGQLIQNTNEACTNLSFSVFSTRDYEELLLYPDGPCKNANLSQSNVRVQFLPCTCPIGFQPKSTEKSKCECECDKALGPHISTCNAQTKHLLRESNVWITYVNGSVSGYLWKSYCPMDYCYPPSKKVLINLNVENGSDSQCALNRSGLLCGTCQPGFSLSLGSSRCILCPTHWPATCFIILVAAVLAGITLVAIILVLNLTVAVGSLNGIIFYANIVAANKSTFFPFTIPNTKFLTMFISWLNLEIGFDTCFFKRMDTYWKMWIQLAFPTYMILLVVAVIIISDRSIRFSRVIGRKNPVATLATLILLSYTTFLKIIIETVSYSTLNYPDGSQQTVWLPDATIQYLSGKHAVLYAVAILILIAGIAYTSLLISWQWLLRCNNFFTKQRLYIFLEPYHAPYTNEHRYWTGLLLLVRVILYIISAVNISNNPDINLLVIGIVMSTLLLLKGILRVQIYKKRALEALELACYFNITLFCLVKLFIIIEATKRDQAIVAYVSGSITFTLFIAVVAYHVLIEVCSVEKILKHICQRKERDENVELSNCSLTNNFQTSQPEPTVSVIDAPTCYEEEPLPQLKEPLLIN